MEGGGKLVLCYWLSPRHLARGLHLLGCFALALALLAGCAANPPASTATPTPLAAQESASAPPSATSTAALLTAFATPILTLESAAIITQPEPTITPVAATLTPSPTPIPTLEATFAPTQPAQPSAESSSEDPTELPEPAAPVDSLTLTAQASPTEVPPSTPTAIPPADSPTSTSTPEPTDTATPVLPTATPVPPPASQGRVVLAYYVPYDGSSWASLAANADRIDYLALQWVSVDACGNIGTQDDRTLVEFARSRGIKLLPSLLTGTGSPNHQLLTEEDSTANLIAQITSYVVEEGYEGFDLDMEGVAAEDRDALTAFVARLSASLHAQGKTLTMAVPAKARDVTTGWAGPYDYAALAPHVDQFVIMSYAYTPAGSDPGSIGPYDWVDRVIAYATSQIPPQKVLMGVGFWGYDWNVTQGSRARSLRYPVAEALANWYGAPIQIDPETRSATFAYVANPGDQPALPASPARPEHEIAARTRPACPKTPPPPPPPPTATPTPILEGPQQHVVWLENRDSVAARLEIADRYGTAGIAAWRLGQEDPAVWPLLAGWK